MIKAFAAVMMALAPMPMASAGGASPAVRFVAPADFNGVALVATGRHLVWAKGFGLANAERGVPVTPDTRFEIGSVSKWIASIVVLKLVDQGKLDLDAPIGRYLPDYRTDTGARLTLRVLLAHRSGLPNQVAAARNDPGVVERGLPQAEAVRRYASGDLRFAPGTDWDYAHSNWVLAQAVVERVTGEAYPALVDRLLVRPLKLKHSGIFVGDSGQLPGAASGYARLMPAPVRKPGPIPNFLAMAGGYSTTAGELLTVMDLVLDGGYLSRASRAALLTVTTPDQAYALGGRIRVKPIAGRDRPAVWNDGTNGAFRMIARRVLADGHSVIALSNNNYDAQLLSDFGDALMAASYARRR